MDAKNRFLTQLYERAGGRIDRTVHSFLHVAKPLAFSMVEMQASADTLCEEGMIEADPGYDRLIRLTPRGAAVCRRTHIVEMIAPNADAAGSFAKCNVAPTAPRRDLTAQ